MDDLRFDRLTRSFATSRRRLIAAAAGATAGLGLGASTALAGDAAPTRRSGVCRSIFATCTRGSQCCNGQCATGRQYPRAIRNRCVCIPNCGGGRCGDDGCGGQCPACDDGWICSEENVCKAACGGIAGFCFLSAEGEEVLNPQGCQSNSWISEGCETDADCEATPDWTNNYAGTRDGNIEVVCTRVLYNDGYQLESHAEGRCFVKPLATGGCWS